MICACIPIQMDILVVKKNANRETQFSTSFASLWKFCCIILTSGFTLYMCLNCIHICSCLQAEPPNQNLKSKIDHGACSAKFQSLWPLFN